MLRTLTRKVTLIALTFLSLFLVAASFAIASISRSQMLNWCEVDGGDDAIKPFNCACQEVAHPV